MSEKPSNPRPALGRGFSALLRPVEDLPQEERVRVMQLKIAQIKLNPKQPRRHFDQERLNELAQSIRIKGVIQPILVRKRGEAYELVAGERRLRASKLAGFDEIPALVREVADQDLLEIALIENIQRHDLDPIDESLAYKNLMEEHGYTQEDLARRVGKNRSTIANMIRLLALPKPLQKELTQGHLSVGHARALLSLENEAVQIALGQKIIEEGLSVREAELLTKAPESTPSPAKPGKGDAVSRQMQANQKRLEEALTTKVRIKSRGDKGKIELDYFSVEEFNRLFELLLKAKTK